jgi:hypothetical protein
VFECLMIPLHACLHLISKFFRNSFYFSQLDPNDPMRQFSFVLQVDYEDKYEVANCEPSIDAVLLLEISESLNETDDMSYLVRKIRESTVFYKPSHLVRSLLSRCLTERPCDTQVEPLRKLYEYNLHTNCLGSLTIQNRMHHLC